MSDKIKACCANCNGDNCHHLIGETWYQHLAHKDCKANNFNKFEPSDEALNEQIKALKAENEKQKQQRRAKQLVWKRLPYNCIGAGNLRAELEDISFTISPRREDWEFNLDIEVEGDVGDIEQELQQKAQEWLNNLYDAISEPCDDKMLGKESEGDNAK